MVTKSVNIFKGFFDTIAIRYALTIAIMVIVGVVFVEGSMRILSAQLDAHFAPYNIPKVDENYLDFVTGRPFDISLLRKSENMLMDYNNFTKKIETGAAYFLCILYACIASAWGYTRSRSIALRLTALADKSTELARGKLGGQLPIDQSAPVEERRLVENFNRLILQLNAMEEDLQYSMSSIAHEIRTPLTVVRGYLTGAKDRVIKLDDETLDRALSSIEGLERIILDLDTLSRLERTELAFQFDDIDASELVQTVAEEFQVAGMRIKLSGADQSRVVRGDYVRVKQILSNILENARRYVGTSTPVSVDISETDKHVAITVVDSGPGFDEEALSNAMRAFWRGDAARVGESGSGLGLAIARAFARGHGGELVLGNRPMGGASITVLLPS